jgi:putative membrane protein insertion efficiency factor
MKAEIKKIFNGIRRITVLLLLSLIKMYQCFLSPMMSPCCRFYPSCSSYGKEAILTHGIIKGLFLLALRVLKCNKWSRGGYDPVSPKKTKNHVVMQDPQTKKVNTIK